MSNVLEDPPTGTDIYCPVCGVKFTYNPEPPSYDDTYYIHGVTTFCPNGHPQCCLPDEYALAAWSKSVKDAL